MLFSSFLIFITFIVRQIFSARILVIPMHWGASHTKSMLPLAETLAEKNHDVFIWTPLFNGVKRSWQSNTVKFRHTVIDTNDQYICDAIKFGNNSATNQFWTQTIHNPLAIVLAWHYDLILCNLALEQGWNSSIKEIIEEPWDLLLTGVIFAPCVYPFAEIIRGKFGYSAKQVTA